MKQDLSGLTQDQQNEVALLEGYSKTHEMRTTFAVVNLAEKYVGHLLESDHRYDEETTAGIALKYAEAMHTRGETYMQKAFQDWKDAKGYVSEPELEVLEPEVLPVVETITRDEALEDTVERVAAGEQVDLDFDIPEDVDQVHPDAVGCFVPNSETDPRDL